MEQYEQRSVCLNSVRAEPRSMALRLRLVFAAKRPLPSALPKAVFYWSSMEVHAAPSRFYRGVGAFAGLGPVIFVLCETEIIEPCGSLAEAINKNQKMNKLFHAPILISRITIHSQSTGIRATAQAVHQFGAL